MNELLFLYSELLIFLVGAFLYGFLTRELHRNPMVARGTGRSACWPRRWRFGTSDHSLTSWARFLLELIDGWLVWGRYSM